MQIKGNISQIDVNYRLKTKKLGTTSVNCLKIKAIIQIKLNFEGSNISHTNLELIN
jgi:hypothetical protein